MINQRIPMNEDEAEAVDRLLAREMDDDTPGVSISRSEPDESGPIRVEIDDRAWLVDEEGHYRKVDG